MNKQIEKILVDDRLSRSNLLVLLFLFANGSVWVKGQKSMADYLKLSHRTVNRSISELSNYGYVRKITSSDSYKEIVGI